MKLLTYKILVIFLMFLYEIHYSQQEQGTLVNVAKVDETYTGLMTNVKTLGNDMKELKIVSHTKDNLLKDLEKHFFHMDFYKGPWSKLDEGCPSTKDKLRILEHNIAQKMDGNSHENSQKILEISQNISDTDDKDQNSLKLQQDMNRFEKLIQSVKDINHKMEIETTKHSSHKELDQMLAEIRETLNKQQQQLEHLNVQGTHVEKAVKFVDTIKNKSKCRKCLQAKIIRELQLENKK